MSRRPEAPDNSAINTMSLNPTSYRQVFEATPMERISMIQAGIGTRDAIRILTDVAMPNGQIFEALGVSKASITRKVASDQILSRSESERILGLAKLIGQVQSMTNDAEADAPAWLATWMAEPVPALGGERPINLIGTMEGQAVVSNMLGHLLRGGFA